MKLQTTYRLSRFLLHLTSLMLAVGAAPAAAQIPLHLSFPACGGAPGITADADGDKTFVHVQDSAGNDFEIRCHRGFASFNYEFWVSFPNGTRSKVDVCELDGGLNDIVLHITGATTTAVGKNGGSVITVGGVISKYYHHNLNSSSDFHTIYDYATKKAVRFDTKREKNADGSRYDRFLEVSRSVIPPAVPMNAQQSEKLTTDQGEQATPADSSCQGGAVDEAATIAESAVSGTPIGTIVVYHPASSPFESIRWDNTRRALRVALPMQNGPRPLSVALPRHLIRPDMALSNVTADGRKVPAIEAVTEDFRTLTFIVPAGERVVWIGNQANAR